MNKNLGIGIVLVAILAVAIISGCVEITPSNKQMTTPKEEKGPIPQIINTNNFVDNDGEYIITGEVRNIRYSNINYVKVIATLYDDDGSIMDVTSTYTWKEIIKPNSKASFRLRSDVDKLPAKNKLQVSFKDTLKQPFENFEIVSQTSKIDDSGYHYIMGEVKNTGNRTVPDCIVIATYYDEEGRVSDVHFGFVEPDDLGPGQIGVFKTYPAKHVTLNNYELDFSTF